MRRLAAAAGKQKGETQRLLEKVQSLSTEAEPSAPLLSRKLYEGLRKAKLADVENALDVTGQLLERNLADEARQTEQHARQALGELRANVEDAAKGVLGDEGQALRQAKAELDGLLAQASRERTEGPSGPGTPQGNQESQPPGPNQPRPGQPGSQPDPQARNQPGSGQQPGDPNQPGGRGQQPGDPNQPGGQQASSQATSSSPATRTNRAAGASRLAARPTGRPGPGGDPRFRPAGRRS